MSAPKPWNRSVPVVSTGASRWDQVTGKVTLPAGKVSSDSGVIAYTDLGVAGREAAHLRYRVGFDASFPFYETGQPVNQALSGKLPGLCSAGNVAFGPDYRPNGYNGFSIRPVFMTGGDVWLYLYDMKSGEYARASPRAYAVFKPGATSTVEMQLVLNTPGVDDGRARLWIDGKLVTELADVFVRLDDQMKIDGTYWCVFFGGSSAAHAPPRDCWITIDPASVKASDGYIGV